MGQAEVLDILEKADQPLSVGEIAGLLNDVANKISKDLNRLLKYHEVDYVEIDRIEAYEKYKCKRRMKKYYVQKKN